ncbi:MAG: hypothetical protein KGQ79_04260 [Proteobacteria bacterium]|nr:hypothetical protein [Pseudomonadota bacterium]MBU6425593.1 hypothetical protein [Rhodospirillales bacterium]
MSDVGPASDHYVELQEAKLFALIRGLLGSVEVDEAWYLKTNPDVAAAVKAGELKSARAHYIIAGYFENRLPRPVTVDEAWYLAEYPDVADAIRVGTVTSASAHFETSGFVEGRLPRSGWSLLSDDGTSLVSAAEYEDAA